VANNKQKIHRTQSTQKNFKIQKSNKINVEKTTRKTRAQSYNSPLQTANLHIICIIRNSTLSGKQMQVKEIEQATDLVAREAGYACN